MEESEMGELIGNLKLIMDLQHFPGIKNNLWTT